jgi:hypothetical protein
LIVVLGNVVFENIGGFMRIVKTIIISLSIVLSAVASKLVVTSDVNVNTTWDADTVLIDKEALEIGVGARLTIAHGTRIIFNQFETRITVKGTISANGTPTDSIYISRLKSSDKWNGIRLVPRNSELGRLDSSSFSYCNLRNGIYFSTELLYEQQGGILHCGSGNFVSLKHCSVTNVQGDIGGAIYCDSASTMKIEDCYFAYNRTTKLGTVSGGGALMTSIKGSVNLSVNNCLFEKNCSRNGGAVRLGSETKALFNNCIFNNDTTYSINPMDGELYGGAIAVFGPADVTLRGCIIIHCRSYGKGGGIYSSDVSLKLINCTLVSNTSVQGGGIYFARGAAASSPQVVNTIIDGNGTLFNIKTPCDSAGCAVYIDSAVAPVFRYCAFSDTIFDYSTKRYTSNMSNCFINRSDFVYRVKRNFADTLVTGFQLDYEDPIVNGGTPDTTWLALPEFDVLGQKRIFGSSVDIGAIEYNGSLIKVFISKDDRKPSSIALSSPCNAVLYSLDGRKLAVFEEPRSPQSIRQFVSTRYSRGIYLFEMSGRGRGRLTEKVLVK